MSHHSVGRVFDLSKFNGTHLFGPILFHLESLSDLFKIPGVLIGSITSYILMQWGLTQYQECPVQTQQLEEQSEEEEHHKEEDM